MAEFQEVIKQAKRMCNTVVDCDECPVRNTFASIDCPFAYNEVHMEDVEQSVMDWAAKNPGPRYPTWVEAWRQLFPAADLIPCPRKHFGFSCACIGEESCHTCLNRQMYPFIAEKLGVKPIGGQDR